jgi:hypothetical protein
MVQEKQRIAQTICRIARNPQHAVDSKVPRAVDVGLRERRDAPEFAREARVVGLSEHFGNELGVGEGVHDGRDEVTAQAVVSQEVEGEFFGREGPVLDAAAAGATGDVERVLPNGGRDEGPVTAETVVRVEDGGVEGAGRDGVLGLCVEAPVPVAVLFVSTWF